MNKLNNYNIDELRKQLRNATRARNEEIFQRHLNGQSYDDIAKQYPLTKTRIGQIIQKIQKSKEFKRE